MIRQKFTKQGIFFGIIVLLVVISLMIFLFFYHNGNSQKDSILMSAKTTVFDYSYPKNPAESLRNALNSAVMKQELPIEVGEVKTVMSDGMEQAKIMLQFTNGNMCAIIFDLKHIPSDYNYSLGGYDNPSFTMAFKDTDNFDDLKTVLGIVLGYISPTITSTDAARLAKNQDHTISVDGYSQPLDIGGYQIVTQYTNPQAFAHIEEFDSSIGVKVTPLMQMWENIQICDFTELKSKRDYSILTLSYSALEDDYRDKSFYADFIIKNVWHCDEWLHGDYWSEIDVVAMDGSEYTLRVETMHTAWDYEFGVGQKYTLYISTSSYHGATIIYAIQQSEVTTPNLRGVPHEMDYSNEDLDNPKNRIEPAGDGKVYDVWFHLLKGSIGESYAALEGKGVGAKQWPYDPVRENYKFVGWFDNVEYTGNPYNSSTSITKDTQLYVKWKYIGSGGFWPRAYHGELLGLKEGDSYNIGTQLNITSVGYNMNLETPKEQRFRWKPLSWKLSDGISGTFSDEKPFQSTILLQTMGKQILSITYLEEIFDGVTWQATGQFKELEEVTFFVK